VANVGDSRAVISKAGKGAFGNYPLLRWEWFGSLSICDYRMFPVCQHVESSIWEI
jgi:hypothetical protein